MPTITQKRDILTTMLRRVTKKPDWTKNLKKYKIKPVMSL